MNLKNFALIVAVLAVIFFVYFFTLPSRVAAHCQVPCGIYGDETRFTMLEEHASTIEKAMKQIKLLSVEKAVNYNQIVRWVKTKDDHANEMIETVSHYFLAQRVKPFAAKDQEGRAKYLRKLELLHHLIFRAMKAKQTTDVDQVAEIRALIKEFKKLYTAG